MLKPNSRIELIIARSEELRKANPTLTTFAAYGQASRDVERFMQNPKFAMHARSLLVAKRMLALEAKGLTPSHAYARAEADVPPLA